jgi:nitroreductase
VPTVIFISGDLSGFNAHTDCGIAAGRLVASASLMGISSCITASSIFLFKEEAGKDVLKRMGVPENYGVVCGVALGYCKGEIPEMPPKRGDLVTYVR